MDLSRKPPPPPPYSVGQRLPPSLHRTVDSLGPCHHYQQKIVHATNHPPPPQCDAAARFDAEQHGDAHILSDVSQVAATVNQDDNLSMYYHYEYMMDSSSATDLDEEGEEGSNAKNNVDVSNINSLIESMFDEPFASHPLPPQVVVSLDNETQEADDTNLPNNLAIPDAADSIYRNGSEAANVANTGRWTSEEHRLFLAAVLQHGKDWKKIALSVKTRTAIQVRTHAQKYLKKLAKERQTGGVGGVGISTNVGVTVDANDDVQSNMGGEGEESGANKNSSAKEDVDGSNVFKASPVSTVDYNELSTLIGANETLNIGVNLNFNHNDDSSDKKTRNRGLRSSANAMEENTSEDVPSVYDSVEWNSGGEFIADLLEATSAAAEAESTVTTLKSILGKLGRENESLLQQRITSRDILSTDRIKQNEALALSERESQKWRMKYEEMKEEVRKLRMDKTLAGKQVDQLKSQVANMEQQLNDSSQTFPRVDKTKSPGDTSVVSEENNERKYADVLRKHPLTLPSSQLIHSHQNKYTYNKKKAQGKPKRHEPFCGGPKPKVARTNT